MATGNTSFRLSKSEHDDDLDELAEILNAVSGTMRSIIIEKGLVIPHLTYQSLIQSTFILDKNFKIQNFSANIPEMLGYEPHELQKTNFCNVLSQQSKEYWQLTSNEVTTQSSFHQTIQLIFERNNGKLIPSFCTISRLLYTDKILISTVITMLQDTFADLANSKKMVPHPADATLIQNLHDYILKNLEGPLPTLKQLSKIFGTNEFKIKDGFRHFYNTSIYQFYNEERLKKAHLLIQQTETSLKSIAFACGFNDYTNFYKAFKKRFGYSPRELSRTKN